MGSSPYKRLETDALKRTIEGEEREGPPTQRSGQGLSSRDEAWNVAL